jgi:hypothetical protein
MPVQSTAVADYTLRVLLKLQKLQIPLEIYRGGWGRICFADSNHSVAIGKETDFKSLMS